jgi:hypothetical protein
MMTPLGAQSEEKPLSETTDDGMTEMLEPFFSFANPLK